MFVEIREHPRNNLPIVYVKKSYFKELIPEASQSQIDKTPKKVHFA